MMKYKTFLTLFFCALTVVQFLPANAKIMYKTFPEKHEKVDIDKTSDLTQFVDTRQGTDSDFGLSYGNTYPATGMPYCLLSYVSEKASYTFSSQCCMKLFC